MIIQIVNDRERIGDFLATIPAMMELAKVHEVYLDLNSNLSEFKQFISENINLGKHPNPHRIYQINIDNAYEVGWDSGKHMTQAYFHQLGLETPNKPIKPRLIISYLKVPQYDIIIAPYSVSLPLGQLWTNEKWNQLVASLPKYKFALIGAVTDPPLNEHPNLDQYLGHKWLEVANLIRNARLVISVVSGISHLTYALGVSHLQLVNQPPWGQNPEAKVKITASLLNEVSVEEVLKAVSSIIF